MLEPYETLFRSGTARELLLVFEPHEMVYGYFGPSSCETGMWLCVRDSRRALVRAVCGGEEMMRSALFLLVVQFGT